MEKIDDEKLEQLNGGTEEDLLDTRIRCPMCGRPAAYRLSEREIYCTYCGNMPT